MQPCNQAVRKFAVSEVVDEGYVRRVLGEQALGLAVVAAGPATSAPKSSSRSFIASPSSQESSTKNLQAFQIIR